MRSTSSGLPPPDPSSRRGVSFTGPPPPPQSAKTASAGVTLYREKEPDEDPDDQGTLQHLLYECPGYSGRSARLSIEPHPMSLVFGLPQDDLAAQTAAFSACEDTKRSFGVRSSRGDQLALSATQRTIVIPLYQRTYTWLEEQGVKFWDDITARIDQLADASWEERRMYRHGLGKIVMKLWEPPKSSDESETIGGTSRDPNIEPPSDSSNPWVCVDGQQRITTTSLLYAAIYAATVAISSVGHSASFHLKTLGSDSSSSPEVTAFNDALKSVTTLVEQMLFVDPDAAKKWARDTVERAQQDPSFEVWPDGQRIPGARVIPSHVDRRAFYEVVTVPLLAITQRQQLASQAIADLGDDLALQSSGVQRLFDGLSISDFTQRALQGQMAAGVFLPRVVNFYESRCPLPDDVNAGTHSSTLNVIAVCAERLKLLERLSRHILYGVGFMLVDIVTPVNISQVFLYLQEKSLFGMGALLWNPAPGIDFMAADLVRNLLLAPFLSGALADQETAHQSLWLTPVESPIRAARQRYLIRHQTNECPFTLDALVTRVMEAQNGTSAPVTPAAASPASPAGDDDDLEALAAGGSGDLVSAPKKRFMSAFEKKVIQISTSLGKKVSSRADKGMGLYAQLYSLFESKLATVSRSTKPVSAAERVVCRELLQIIAAAVAPFVEEIDAN